MTEKPSPFCPDDCGALPKSPACSKCDHSSDSEVDPYPITAFDKDFTVIGSNGNFLYVEEGGQIHVNQIK